MERYFLKILVIFSRISITEGFSACTSIQYNTIQYNTSQLMNCPTCPLLLPSFLPVPQSSSPHVLMFISSFRPVSLSSCPLVLLSSCLTVLLSSCPDRRTGWVGRFISWLIFLLLYMCYTLLFSFTTNIFCC